MSTTPWYFALTKGFVRAPQTTDPFDHQGYIQQTGVRNPQIERADVFLMGRVGAVVKIPFLFLHKLSRVST